MNNPSAIAAVTESEKVNQGCTTRREKEREPHDTRKSNRVMSYIIPPALVVLVIFTTYVWFDMCIQWYLRNDYTATGACLITFQVILISLVSTAFGRIALSRAGYLPNQADRNRAGIHDGGESGYSPSGDSNLTSEYKEQHKTYDRRPTKKETLFFMSLPNVSQAQFYIARADSTDGPRYCATCDIEKYDRVHHCSEVNRCIKKFDHFCPWVGGPIGHTRYKFFFQFITYVAITTLFEAISLGVAVSQRRRAVQSSDYIRHVPANPGLWYASIALCSIFALLMVPFSGFHGHQIANNKSTVESVDTRSIQVICQITTVDDTGRPHVLRRRVTLQPEANPFDLGWWQNWQQVMGLIILDKWLFFRILNWILPICASPGDGLNFPYNEKLMQEMCLQAQNAQAEPYAS